MDEDKVRLDRRFDWVGPPDRVSKIRPIRLRRVDNESALEKDYREAREALNRWNSEFWCRHNTLFTSEKAKFVEEKKAQLSRLDKISDKDMSIFYKNFLNGQRQELLNYNREWYRRNLSLIWPALRVNLVRFGRLFLRR